MQGIYVDDRLVSEKELIQRDSLNKIEYVTSLLAKWHKDKPEIHCACQEDEPRPKMHVRRTPSGGFTLANNPEQSDKHDPSCPFYSHLEYSTDAARKPKVERDGERLIVQVSLFPSNSEKKEKDPLEAAKTAEPDEEKEPSPQRTNTMAEFAYHWYQLAVELIEKDGKPADRRSVLFNMWRCLIDHKIFIGKKDFYYIGYIPNPRIDKIRGLKVIAGYVINVEQGIDDQVWTIEGWKGATKRVTVKKRHVPKYHVLNKLAVLRGDCDESMPITVGPAMAWRITKQGWFLFSDAEWELLKHLQQKELLVERPVHSGTAHFGHCSSFYVPERESKVPILIDVLDDPSSRMQRYNKTLDEDLFHESQIAEEVVYVPWRSGEPINIE